MDGDQWVPYEAGVVDRLMAWVDGFRGSWWWVYLALLAILIMVANAVTWFDGSEPVGTFTLYRTSLPVYPVASLALMHYLNGVARRALAAFRPALGADDADYALLEYELTTLPERGTWLAIGLSVVFTAAFWAFAPNQPEVFSRSPALVWVDVAMYVITFGLVAAFVYHTLHQLRMVSVIHSRAAGVNLFQPTPLYAFSRLTAQTGVALLLMNYFSVLTDPATFVNPALIALTIFASVGAVACFVVPLWEMHDRIVREKGRLRAEADARLDATIQELYRRADARRLTGIDQVQLLMTSLVTTREVLAKIRTWPWELGTLTGFGSALLPAVAGITVFVLERFVVISVR